MKKARCIASIALVFLLGTMTACDSSETVIATVNQESLYKWQLDLMIEEQLPNFVSQNEIDPTKPENWQMMKIFKEALLNEMVNQVVAMEKAKQLGLDKLTPEELAEVDAQYAQQYEANIVYYASNYPNDPKAREKGAADFEKVIKKKKLTPERIKQSIIDNVILMKLYQQEFAEYRPTEEEVQAWYDENVALQKQKFDEKPELFGEEGGALQLYVPEGYIRVKQIFIGPSEETQLKLQQIAAKQGEVIMALANVGDSEAEANKLNEQLQQLEQQATTARQEGLAKLRPRIDEVLAKVRSGADFELLIDEYNEDPNMNTMPAKQLGYLMCPTTTNFPSGLRDAALALQEVGDVSDVVVSSEGYHIVRLYEKITPGTAPLERIRESIEDIIMKNNSFTPMVDAREQWKQEMNIVLYTDKL